MKGACDIDNLLERGKVDNQKSIWLTTWWKEHERERLTIRKCIFLETKIQSLPSSATTSTWFSLSIMWNDMFPSHNTAASISKACSWSSLQIRTVSKASCKKRGIKYLQPKKYWLGETMNREKLLLFTKVSYLSYHEHLKFLSIIDVINGQAVTLI